MKFLVEAKVYREEFEMSRDGADGLSITPDTIIVETDKGSIWFDIVRGERILSPITDSRGFSNLTMRCVSEERYTSSGELEEFDNDEMYKIMSSVKGIRVLFPEDLECMRSEGSMDNVEVTLFPSDLVTITVTVNNFDEPYGGMYGTIRTNNKKVLVKYLDDEPSTPNDKVETYEIINYSNEESLIKHINNEFRRRLSKHKITEEDIMDAVEQGDAQIDVIEPCYWGKYNHRVDVVDLDESMSEIILN